MSDIAEIKINVDAHLWLVALLAHQLDLLIHHDQSVICALVLEHMLGTLNHFVRYIMRF
jgi:hypothetical protein